MSKAEKIKSEIERRKDEFITQANSFESLGMTEKVTYFSALASNMAALIRYIDSLEQPIKRTPADIEAAMQEVEEKSKLFTEAHKEDVVSNDPISNPLEISRHVDSHIGETLEKAAGNYAFTMSGEDEVLKYYAFIAGAQWQKEHLWKDAQGDDLPEIDREVIVLVKSLPEHEDSLLKVSFAHRPPEYWMGKNIGTGEITRYEPKRYDKGGWNQPAVVWWLDVELPKEEE